MSQIDNGVWVYVIHKVGKTWTATRDGARHHAFEAKTRKGLVEQLENEARLADLPEATLTDHLYELARSIKGES